MTHSDNIPEYHELVDALVAMAVQYLSEGPRGLIYEDNSISSDAMCVDALTRLGLLKDRQIIDDAFEPGYLENRFKPKKTLINRIDDSKILYVKRPSSKWGDVKITTEDGIEIPNIRHIEIRRNPDRAAIVFNDCTVVDYFGIIKYEQPPTPPHHKKPDKPTA